MLRQSLNDEDRVGEPEARVKKNVDIATPALSPLALRLRQRRGVLPCSAHRRVQNQ